MQHWLDGVDIACRIGHAFERLANDIQRRDARAEQQAGDLGHGFVAIIFAVG